MATIITKNSSTASSVPTNAQLVQGELAVNVTDKRLFTENASGTVVELGTNPSSLTLPNGVANGVPYLNGSKVLTTGSALVFDGSNLGLGVTPSAWATYKAFDIGYAGNGLHATGQNDLNIGSNAYFNSGYKYAGTGRANLLEMYNGEFYFKTAPSGTAGNAISFTQAMTLDASGNLGIGTTSVFDGNTRLELSKGGNCQQFITCTDGVRMYFSASGNTVGAMGTFSNHPLVFRTNDTERARIDSSGNLLVGTTTSSGWGNGHRIYKNVAQGTIILSVDGGIEYSGLFFAVSAGGYSGTGAAQFIGKHNSTLRSINAGGTVNASGADYAEYMTKAGDFTVAKGDVVGINADGKLTNVFDDAVSFCVKSTNPSYVGGDVWGNEDALGKRPADDATDKEKAAYADALEAARQKVDRIAFAGQVPVNVMGAIPGQYIVPVDDNGAIKGIAKSEADMTLAEYMKAVGKVIAIEADGRAKIIVKVA